jgi:hypothetical protein
MGVLVVMMVVVEGVIMAIGVMVVPFGDDGR